MAAGKEQRQQRARDVVGALVGRGSCQAERRAQGVGTFLCVSCPGLRSCRTGPSAYQVFELRKGNLSGISRNGFERNLPAKTVWKFMSLAPPSLFRQPFPAFKLDLAHCQGGWLPGL
jgi:hypothetical protein